MPLYARTILITGSSPETAAASEEHKRHLRDLDSRGKLRLAVELQDGDGYLEILVASDRMEAESIARASPLVEKGLAAWMLRGCVELDLGS